jgi:hypothetical protein
VKLIGLDLSDQPLSLLQLLQLGNRDACILLLLQGGIDRIDPLQAVLHGGQHLLLQEGDLLLSVGMLNPGAAEKLADLGGRSRRLRARP